MFFKKYILNFFLLLACVGASAQVTTAQTPQLITVTATGTIPQIVEQIIVNNGATSITLTLPTPVGSTGKRIIFSRAAGSTGAVTLLPGAGQIQSLSGTLGASTTLAAHSAAGAGLNIGFRSNGTNWLR